MGDKWNKKYSKLTIDYTTVLTIKTVRKLMRRHKMSINTIFYQRGHNRKEQTTFLHHAIEKKNVQLINWLVARKVDPNISPRNLYGAPLSLACFKLDFATVRKLVKLGARINIRSPSNGIIPLWQSRINRNTSIVKFLIKNGADVNMEVTTGTPCKGYSPLQIYADDEDIELIKLLLAEGANVNHKSADGSTPLLCAASDGHFETVKLLIDHGAEINCQTMDGYTPLMGAASCSNVEVVKLLLHRGADIRCEAADGRTPLICASMSGNIEMIKLIHDHGAEMNCACEFDDEIKTSLHYAISFHHWYHNWLEPLEFFFNLYESATPIKILTGIKKRSLLHYVLDFEYLCTGDRVAFLLDNGVDVNLEDRDKMLAIDYSARHSKGKCHLMIRKHLVKLISANLPVCQRNENAIGDGLEDFAADCREEVNKMKNTKIGDVNTTFYNVLHVNEHKLAVKVKFLQSDFQNKEKSCEMFPLYGGMLFYKLSGAQKRMQRREKAEEILGEIFLCCDLPYDFLRELFNYLNELDLRIIIAEKIPDLSKILTS